MAAIRRFLLRVVFALRNGRAERDLTREMDAHLALLEDDFIARGMSADAARLAARKAIGGIEQAKELQRDARSFRWIEDVPRDLAYALRSLRRSPAFTMAAVLTLAVGIGTTTAIYSVVDRVLLQPLPFPNADRLVRIIEPERPLAMPSFTHTEYLQWRSKMTTLSALAAMTFNPQALIRTRDGIARVSGGLVSTNYFETIGATAFLGRTIQSSDDQDRNVIVLSFETWQRYFHSDPAVVGTPVELRSPDRLLTVVGVMPEGQQQLGNLDFYVPLAVESKVGLGPLIGRLRDDVSIAAAEQEANAVGAALRPPRPASAKPLTRPRFNVAGLKDNIVAELQPALRVFVTAVAVVLLIVCANLANLLLARGSARRREIAVRLAVGASRARIVRQVLTECFLLALIGGGLGAAIGALGVATVKRLASVPADGVWRLVFRDTILPRANEVHVDYRIFVIALVLSAITAVLFGLLPALQLSRTDHVRAMGGRGDGESRLSTRWRSALVLGQVVMATILLTAAGLLMRSFINLSSVEKGYDPRNVLTFQLVLPTEYSTTRKSATIEAILTKLRTTRGVQAAGFAYAGILLGIQDMAGTWVPPGGSYEALQAELEKPRLKTVSLGYLETMGVRVLDGRGFEERDSENAPPVAIVNRSIARRFFSDRSPIGQTLQWHGGGVNGQPLQVEIIGVVDDIRQGSVDQPPYSEIFMDYRQIIAVYQRRGANVPTIEHFAFGFLSFGLRTAGDPAAAIPIVRRVITEVDGNAGIDAIVPMDRLVSNSVARQRFYAVMLGSFAGVAGLLAAIGIYGVLAYIVVQRTQEIGVRMALGAERRQVMTLILRRGLTLAVIGIGIGVAGATGAAKYLQSMLFGVEARDPQTFIAIAIAFAFIALVASYLPARRATKVDPIVALRVE